MTEKDYTVISVRIPNDTYERLLKSSEQMGLKKSSYILYALRQTFNAEDISKNLPDLVQISKQLQGIQARLDEQEGLERVTKY